MLSVQVNPWRVAYKAATSLAHTLDCHAWLFDDLRKQLAPGHDELMMG
jgi:hypothetical protein